MKPNIEPQTKSLQKFPVDFLREIFLERRERNPSYSTASFARDLGISRSLLSRVLTGSRPITLKLALQISTALDLGEEKSNALVLSIIHNSSKSAKISKKIRAKFENNNTPQSPVSLFTTVEIEQFKAMSSWYHLAILNMTVLDGFQNDPVWIAQQLGITTAEVIDAIERMIGVGLLTESENALKRTKAHFYVKTNRSEFAVRKFHTQMISKASEELKNTSDADFQRRLINGITFTCGPEHIELIKEKINRLEDEILNVTSNGASTDVYQMNFQFFPLTKNKKGESKS